MFTKMRQNAKKAKKLLIIRYFPLAFIWLLKAVAACKQTAFVNASVPKSLSDPTVYTDLFIRETTITKGAGNLSRNFSRNLGRDRDEDN